MPSSYTMDTLPVPKDTELELKEVPGHTLAVYSFFGAPPSEKQIGEVAKKLKAKVEVRIHLRLRIWDIREIYMDSSGFISWALPYPMHGQEL